MSFPDDYYGCRRMNRHFVIVVAFVVLYFGPRVFMAPAFAGDPFEDETPERVLKDAHRGEAQTNIGAWLASFFSKHISAVDGDRCPSEPTCSSYSAQAFRKHGLVMGWLMTVDRLIHEGDEWHVSPVKNRGGKGKIIDPVENNDYWWYEDESKGAPR